MNTRMQGFDLNAPIVDIDAMTVNFSFAANVVNLADQVIVDACVKSARKAGITQLYLIDKQFLHDAIREKLARDGGGEYV